MNFAQNLKRIMNEKKITNYRLAKILGVHPTTVKNWLESYTQPKFEMIDRIAEALETTTQDLLSSGLNEEIKEIHKRSTLLTYLLSKLSRPNVDEKEIKEIFESLLEYTDYYNQEPLKQLSDTFNTLNSKGKQKALDYITDLSEQEKYTKPDEE